MAVKTWTLTDVEQDIFVDQITLGPEQVGGSARGYSVTKRVLRGGLRDGVDVIEVHNGRCRFVVIPTRGMNLWRAEMGDVQLGWQSPVKGPVHPKFVPLWDGTGIGWLNGFDELLAHCGLESNGAPEFSPSGSLLYPLHGKVGNIPAQKVKVSIDGESGEIAVTGVVEEMRLFGNILRMTSTYRTKIGEPGVTITDVVSNPSAQPSELELLYHINMGMPLLGDGAKITLPVKKLAPHNAAAVQNLPQWNTYGPEGSIVEVVYCCEPQADAQGKVSVLLENAAGNQGLNIQFNKQQLPYFTLWKNLQAASQGYVSGLEPTINFPNQRSFEKAKGRVAVLAPGESRTFELTLHALGDAQSIADVKKSIVAIQGNTKPEILSKQNPEWSPA
jgi:galactose mutarotase-like enzyme